MSTRGGLKVEFNGRLGDSWQDLCDVLEMSALDQGKLAAGHRGSEIWVWLEIRGRLGQLPQALQKIGREDLATILAPELLAESYQSVPRTYDVALSADVAKIAVSKLPRTGEFLVGRESELAILDEAWESAQTQIMQIVAPGGVGKTQLVKKWREGLLDKENHSGATRAYDWSFYSQGTGQQASADDFFSKALEWFGESDLEKYKDPWTKGERLAELVREQRTLLILDGMEPLQHPPGPMAGELIDPSIKALLQGLQRDNPGLCIVTTREAVPTLDEMSEPKRRTIDLGTLSPESGSQLLQQYGVTGEPEELLQASIDVQGHALALILLATYLKDRSGGDVTQRFEALLFRGHERYAAHAHKVMASYEAWFGQQDEVGQAAVAILHLMGLFNRPADTGCIAALRAAPPIPGLTDSLFVSDREEVWQRALERLRAARLLAEDEGGTGALDAHPLVREHFEERLNSNDDAVPEGESSPYREAHRRLYEHLKQSAPEQPDNLNDMMPLYHAVAHGCKAGLHELAILDLFWHRIHRDQEFYSLRKLGAFTTDLATISSAFEKPWTTPSSFLSERVRTQVIGVAGALLRAVSRLREAREPLSLSVVAFVKQEVWTEAAINASNLSELLLTLGDVSSAVRHGEQSVELADHSGDAFHQWKSRVRLADALFRSGERDVPSDIYEEAEKGRGQTHGNTLLMSAEGYFYCDFLLSIGKAKTEEVRQRAEAAFEYSSSRLGPLDIGLDRLTLGRTSQSHSKAEHHLNQSVTLLRQAGQQDYLPRGLLYRAALWREMLGAAVEWPTGVPERQDFSEAGTATQVDEQSVPPKELLARAELDLSESESIAERGSMLIWQIEAALERSQLYLTLHEIGWEGEAPAEPRSGDSSQAETLRHVTNCSAGASPSRWLELAQEKLDETKRLVKETDKPYEPHVPDWVEWEPPEYVGGFKNGDIVGYHCRDWEIARVEADIEEARNRQ